MKKIKLLTTVLIVASIALGIIGCKDPEIHVHTYSEVWTSDANGHWHEATCEHTTEVSGKAEHTFGDWQVITAATEEAEGKQERKCIVCPYTATEAIEKLAHTHKFATDWTKDETHHWYAATCEHTTEVSGKAAHSFGDWKVTQEATEEAEGSKERTCTVCGYPATEVIEKLEHKHKFASEWTSDETNHWHAATCEHKDEVIDKVKHTFGDWTITKEPTEETEGTREKSCTVCEYRVPEVIEKLEHKHKFAEAWTKNETNHWHAATCEHPTEVSEKAKHTFGDWTTTKAATEEAEGSRERSCSVCGYTATETIEKLAHTHKFAEEWTSDETNHWHASTCGHDVTEAKEEHTFVNEVCTICEYSRIPEGFVLIPAGTFQMGSEKGYSDNKPVHEVTITKPFYMGKYEVTQAEYEVYCSYGSSSPSSSYGDGDNYPAYYVSWYDALVYCNKRSMAEGLTPCYSINDSTDPEDWGDVPTSSNGTWNSVECNWNANGYRLPTEAEWEYAARAGDNTVDSLTYSGTSDVNKLGDYAWYYDSANDNTHEVGTKLPNAFGLYDMSGNVWEWCWNWFTDSYDTTTEGGSDPTGASAGSSRVNRGGRWYSNSDGCAVSFRNSDGPNGRYYDLGFRVVRASSN